MAFNPIPDLDKLTFDTDIELPPITKELVERLEARYGKDRGAIQMYLRRYSIERDTQLLMKGQKKLKEEANELKKEAMKEAVELNSGSVDMAAISRNLTYLKEKLEKNGILTPSQKQNKEAAASVITKAYYDYKTYTQKMNTATSKSKIKVIEEEVSVKTEIKVKRRRFNFDE